MIRRHWLKLVVLIAVLAIGVPFLPAELFRTRIHNALEQGLGRKVEIGEIHFTLLPGVIPAPGFTLDQVLIHEDERAGIEPFAYVETLGASVRLLSLFSRKLEFSTLNLGDATINIVKPDTGPWNYQMLLARAPDARALPALRMRGGRINFKFGDTKSVFYFNDADLDIAPALDGSLDLRFGGIPSRTNRTAQEAGKLFVRGSAREGNQNLNFRVELEKSSLDEVAHWVAPNLFGIHGTVTLAAQVTGSPGDLKVDGQLQVGDIHRWDLLPQQASMWEVDYSGKLDLLRETLEVSSKEQPATPVAVKITASHWLTQPQWAADAKVQDLNLETLLKLVRHLGATIPETLTASGRVSGEASFRGALAGRFALADAAITMPDSPALQAPAATLTVADGQVKLEKTSVQAASGEPAESAELEGSYNLPGSAEAGALDVRVTTKGMNAATLRRFAISAIPVIRDVQEGTWRGSVRYHRGAPLEAEQGAEWTGGFDLKNALLPVDGLAEPVRILSAAVNLTGDRLAVTKLHGRAGKVEFAGDYRWDPAAARPHRFTLALGEVDGPQLQKLLAPVLSRQSGFFARTLRLGSAPELPEWLKARRVEGSISMEALTMGEYQLSKLAGSMTWEGPQVKLQSVKAQLEGASFTGSGILDLAARAPHVSFEGGLANIAWHGGSIDLEGKCEAVNAADFLASLKAEGRFTARSVELSPEAEFRTGTGAFEVQGFGAQAKWKLANMEVNQAGEVLTGSGVTAPEGRIQLDLMSKGKAVRYSAALK